MREITARDMIPTSVYKELDSRGDSQSLAAIAADLRDIDPTMRIGDEDPAALEVVQNITKNGDGRSVVWRQLVGRDTTHRLDIPVAAAVAVPDEVSGVENGTLLLWTTGQEHLLVPGMPHNPESMRAYRSISEPGNRPFRLMSPRLWITHLAEQFEINPLVMHAAIHPAQPEEVSKIKGRTLATFAVARGGR